MLTTISLLTLAVISGDASVTVSEREVRQVIQQSVPYIQERGDWWVEKKKCVSCHRVNTMVWSLRTADELGFEVSDRLEEWQKWATDASLSKNDKGEVVGVNNQEGVAQLILSLANGKESSEAIRSLSPLLLEGQQPDGSWKSDGQLPSQKRPESETHAVSTMWLTLALAEGDKDERVVSAVDRATKFIEQSSDGKSTEWYAVRLLLAVHNQNDQLRGELIQRIQSQQRPDGGWGWTIDATSDALGTGIALYAIAKAGVSSDDPSIGRAQRFLADTQRDDGSWEVHGTKANKKDRPQETASYWGTTWAALGLMATLPKPTQ